MRKHITASVITMWITLVYPKQRWGLNGMCIFREFRANCAGYARTFVCASAAAYVLSIRMSSCNRMRSARCPFVRAPQSSAQHNPETCEQKKKCFQPKLSGLQRATPELTILLSLPLPLFHVPFNSREWSSTPEHTSVRQQTHRRFMSTYYCMMVELQLINTIYALAQTHKARARVKA